MLEVSDARTALNRVKLDWWYSGSPEIALEYVLWSISEPPYGPAAGYSCPYIILFVQVADNLSSPGYDVVINLKPS